MVIFLNLRHLDQNSFNFIGSFLVSVGVQSQLDVIQKIDKIPKNTHITKKYL